MYLIRALPLVLMLALSSSNLAQAETESAEAEKPYSGKQSSEWTEVQKKLSDYKSKLQAQDALVKSLISEKTKASVSSQRIKSKEIQLEHRKLKEMTEEYNRLSSEYDTKFPEKGVKENRIYKRTDVKSIEGIENELTAEGRLNKLHMRVLQQYPGVRKAVPKIKKSESSKSEPEPIAAPIVNEKDLSEPIIFQK